MAGFTSTKTFRRLVWTASILLVILMVAYYLIISNAESLVQKLIAYESKGKFKVTVEKIRFNPFRRRIDLINISLQSDKIAEGDTGFEFSGDNISLQLSHVRPLIFRQQLLVDSILFESPRLKILQQPVRKGWGTNSARKMTLHEALGDVYVKMQNLFKVLFVKRGEINNAELTIAENTDPAHPILGLKGIYFLLEKLNVQKGSHSQDDKFMFSQNITFRTGPENIVLPDGLHQLSFSQLTLNTFKRFIEINDCHIQGVSKDNPDNKFDIFNKKLKLVNLDFTALYTENIIRADSVYCLDPDIKLELGRATNANLQTKKIGYTYDSLQQIVKLVTGDLSVKYLGIVNAKVNTFFAIDNKVNTISTSHASFEVYDLNVNTASGMPATVSRVDFAVVNYKGYTPDSIYIIKFDSIRLLSDRLVLWNAALSPQKKNLSKNFKDVHVDRFELTDVNWLDFLKNKRITANRALLQGADVKIFADRNNKTKVKGSAMDLIHSINPSLNVRDLIISNATIEYEVKDKFSLVFQNASVEVSVRDLITTDSIENIRHSLRHLIADKGELKTKRMTASLSGISYFKSDSMLSIQKMQMHNEKGVSVNAENFFVEGFKKSGNDIYVHGIGWKKATVNIRPVSAAGEEQVMPKRRLQFEAGRIDFANTVFSFEKDDQKINSFINSVQGISVKAGKDIEVKDLRVSGNGISFESAKEKLKTGAFSLEHNAASWINVISFNQNKQESDLSLELSSIKLKPDINQVLQKKYVISDVVLESPTVRYTRRNAVENADNKKNIAGLPIIDINALLLVKPSIVMDNTGDKKMHLDLRGEEIKINNIKTDSKKLDAGGIAATLNSIQYKNANGVQLESGKGNIETIIDAAQYRIEKDTAESRWQALIGRLAVHNIQYKKTRNDSLLIRADISSFVVNDFLAKEKSMKNFERLVRDNPNVHVHNATAAINTPATNFYVRDLRYKNKNVLLDSLAVIPVMSFEEFNAQTAFQRDYIKVRSGNIEASGVDLLRYATEKKLFIANLKINDAVLNVSKDKRLVFETGVIKPLPAKMMKKVSMPVFIDTVNISDGYVSYTETSEKTYKTGTISFNKLNAWIHPLKNFDLQPTDSLRLRAEAFMLDSMQVSLRIRESYTDTLAGFWMTVGIRPAEIPILNPVLEPLASVQVGSGKLDHLEMRAVGREYISFGEMKFYYHDLKIKILKNGDLETKNFLTSMATFVANKFVIHTNNTERQGRVFFVRNRERSIFNYWLKMTLSGVASSAGAKSNRKMLKKYKDEIKTKQLPPINLD